jgi:hypothetical protein
VLLWGLLCGQHHLKSSWADQPPGTVHWPGAAAGEVGRGTQGAQQRRHHQLLLLLLLLLLLELTRVAKEVEPTLPWVMQLVGCQGRGTDVQPLLPLLQKEVMAMQVGDRSYRWQPWEAAKLLRPPSSCASCCC